MLLNCVIYGVNFGFVLIIVVSGFLITCITWLAFFVEELKRAINRQCNEHQGAIALDCAKTDGGSSLERQGLFTSVF